MKRLLPTFNSDGGQIDRPLAFGWMIVLTLLTTGCISSDTLVRVRADGSGTLIQHTLMNTQIIQNMISTIQDVAKAPNSESEKVVNRVDLPDFFSEKEARARAASFGPGVTYVSSRSISTADQQGMEAIYAFRDVNRLCLNQKPGMAGTSQDGQYHTTTRFRLARLANDLTRLTVFLDTDSGTKGSQSGVAPSTPPAADKKQNATPAEAEQIKKLFQGFRFAVAVEVDGVVTKTNSHYLEGSRVTLFELDFSKMMSDATALQGLALARGQVTTLDEASTLLQELHGMKVPFESKIQIDFQGN